MTTKTTTSHSQSFQHIPRHISTIIHQFADDAKLLFPKEIMAEYLFGSYAKNTYTSRSDIDILILVNHFSPDMQRQLSGLASDYSLEYDLYISPIVKDIDVWKKNQSFQTLFYQEVTEYGILL
ncbi:MAG: nucleotidyltransferase domain-containing protein [Methanosarcinaceae archaeon]|nr:nucleotidyltransferase domain-containing protein [Methanosarcinaceae archaeon]